MSHLVTLIDMRSYILILILYTNAYSTVVSPVLLSVVKTSPVLLSVVKTITNSFESFSKYEIHQ